jgi:hypothetical protein
VGSWQYAVAAAAWLTIRAFTAFRLSDTDRAKDPSPRVS